MNDDIPPLQRPEDMPPVHSQADLHRHWRALMGPLGFTRPALWLHLLTADDRAEAMITKIDELPDRPDDRLLTNLLWVCAELLENDVPGGKVAFLYSRPGSRLITDDDRAWARGLTSAARRAGVPCAPVHLANDEELRVFAPDDLAEPGSAA
ncbi:MAG TPA: hypothetical protein VFG63_06040 [Nocardioidaceae bacterium]|nr:hypothetical protein [Nocardioidaceae bacterium]